jgi:MoxR-like ATPase
VADASDILEAQKAVREVHVSRAVTDYIVAISMASRAHPETMLGGSPRASLALHRASQAMALILQRKFVTPDLVKSLAPATLRHRIILQPQARISGRTPDQVIAEILQSIEVPVCNYEK